MALGGDGLVGKLAGALRDSTRSGSCPPAAATTSPARSGSRRTSAGPRGVLLDGVRKALDLGEANGNPFACIASMGYDSEANRIANEAKLVRGNLVYAYAAIRALMAWKPARFTVRARRDEHRFEGYTVAAANTGYYGGGMNVAPGAGSLRRAARRGHGRASVEASLPAKTCRRCSRAPTSTRTTVKVDRAREVEIAADRPFDVYADGDPLTTLPATVRLVRGGAERDRAALPEAGLRLKVALARAAGAGCPAQAGAAAARASRASCCCGWTHGRSRASAAPRPGRDRRQRDQRQDDHGRDDRRDPARRPVTPVHNRAGANMPGGVATALLEQPAATARRRSGCSRSTRRGCRAWWTISPHTVLLGNLFRDQLDRYGELEKLADEWSALVADRAGRTSFVLNADDPLVADLGRDATALGVSASPTSASRTAPRAGADRARLRCQALPPLRDRLQVRPHTSATSACTSARAAATRGRALVAAARTSS